MALPSPCRHNPAGSPCTTSWTRCGLMICPAPNLVCYAHGWARSCADWATSHTGCYPTFEQIRQRLVGGDFNWIAEQLDLLDPHGIPGGRHAGYYDGLRHVEAERQLFDVWRDQHATRRSFTQESYHRDISTVGSMVDLRGSAATLDSLGRCHRADVRLSGDYRLRCSVMVTAPGGTILGDSAWYMPLSLG